MAARRILFIENSIGLSGSTMSLTTLLNGLDRARFDPVIAVSRSEQAAHLREHLREPAPVVVIGPGNGLKYRGWMTRLTEAGSPLPAMVRHTLLRVAGLIDLAVVALPYALRLRAFARGRRIDLIHQNNGFDFGAVFLAQMLGTPLVAYQRGDEWNSPVSRWFARRVTRFVANSQATKRSLDALGVPEERMLVVYPPLDLDVFDAERSPKDVRAALGLDADVPCIGMVGILMPWKGQRVFLKAIRRVADEVPRVRALVIGAPPSGGEAYAQELSQLARDLGIEDRVIFTGFRSDVADLLASLDIFVHASVKPEPFGRVIAEAMAMRCPVVAAAAGGPMEIIENGRSGLLVPPGDDEALASGLASLLRNPQLAERMAEQAAHEAVERFSAKAHVAVIEGVYDSVLDACGAQR